MAVENAMYDIYQTSNELWEFRSMNGVSYWFNQEKNLTSNEYPYLMELEDYIEKIKVDIENA